MEYSKRISDEQSVKYYEEVIQKKKKTLITCDSNNRQTTLRKLRDGDIPFPKGTYTLNTSHGPHILNLSEDTYYNDLPEESKPYVDAITLLKIIITEATRKNLAEVFDAVNRGVTQNAQELRQSWFSNFAQPIRDLSRKYHNKFLDSGDRFGLSRMAYNFLGGIIKFAQPLSAFFNPKSRTFSNC